MAKIGRKKASAKGGGKLSRSKTVTIRLDPKTRYLAEIAARSQRRTVSSFIEWAIERSFESVGIKTGYGMPPPEVPLAERQEEIWHVDEAIRFALLAIHHHYLLTAKEQLLWQIVYDSGLLHGALVGEGRIKDWDWEKLGTDVFPELRKRWNEFNEIADVEAEQLGYS